MSFSISTIREHSLTWRRAWWAQLKRQPAPWLLQSHRTWTFILDNDELLRVPKSLTLATVLVLCSNKTLDKTHSVPVTPPSTSHPSPTLNLSSLTSRMVRSREELDGVWGEKGAPLVLQSFHARTASLRKAFASCLQPMLLLSYSCPLCHPMHSP